MNTNKHPVDSAVEALGTTLEGLGGILGVSKGAISQWKAEGRVVPVRHCVHIERITSGAVTRIDLRPDDYWLIWPDLPAPAAHEESRHA